MAIETVRPIAIGAMAVLVLLGIAPASADGPESAASWEEIDEGGTLVDIGVSATTASTAAAQWTGCTPVLQVGQIVGFNFAYDHSASVSSTTPASYTWRIWLQLKGSLAGTQAGPISKEDRDQGTEYFPGMDVRVTIRASSEIKDAATGLDYSGANADHTKRCRVT